MGFYGTCKMYNNDKARNRLTSHPDILDIPSLWFQILLCTLSTPDEACILKKRCPAFLKI